jgi:hypothetical protein
MISNGSPLDLAVRSAIKAPAEEERVISELMGIAMNASFVKNQETGEDELSIFVKLQDEVTDLKKKMKKADDEKKAWQTKAKTLLEGMKKPEKTKK